MKCNECLLLPGSFLAIEPVMLIPFEPKLIDYSMLSSDQIAWLNYYNDRVKSEILPYFESSGNDLAVEWINARTYPVASKQEE